MKKLNLSLAAIFAMGTFAVAGGDIAPVEPVVEEPVVVESTGNFYLGLAYGYLNDDVTVTDYAGNLPGNNLGAGATYDLWDNDHSEIMIQAGYNFNEYIAVEGRYWFGVSDDAILNGVAESSVDAWGLYVKPQYSFDAFKIYALLGYGAADYTWTITDANGWKNSYSDDSVDGFSWGLGAAYAFTDNVEVFIDYVSIYNDDADYVDAAYGIDANYDRTIDTWNFGVTYNF